MVGKLVVIIRDSNGGACLERHNTEKCFTTAFAVNRCANERRGAFSKEIDKKTAYIGKWIQSVKYSTINHSVKYG